MSDVNAKVAENLRGIRVIKSFAAEDYELNKFEKITDHNMNMTIRTIKRSALVLPSMEAVGGIAIGLLLLIGSAFILKGYITFPDLGEYIMLAFIVANSVKSISKLKVVQQQIIAASERIFEIIDMKSDQKEIPNPKKLTDPKGEIEFKNVNFSYENNEKVINNLSFYIKPSEVVALVGVSGSGKSTIADLLPRFYDVDSGEILFDGENVKNYSLKDLREMIAIVPQETILFSGTVMENIAYGDIEASKDSIIEAAKNANAHDFIMTFSEGYNTILGEAGTGLSGGQRQRIAIARALLRKKSKVIVMDEATSALDMESEAVVQEAIERAMKGKTTIIIAHRLSTVKNADKIFVIDNGKLVETGTFDQLLSQNGIFSNLYSSSLISDHTS